MEKCNLGMEVKIRADCDRWPEEEKSELDCSAIWGGEEGSPNFFELLYIFVSEKLCLIITLWTHTNSSPSQPEIHWTGSCETPAQSVSPLTSDTHSNAVATQPARNTRSCYCTWLTCKSLNVRFPFKIVKPILLSFPIECVCLQYVEQFCRQPKLNVPKTAHWPQILYVCYSTSGPSAADTPTFRVLSEGTNLNLPQRNLFRVEVPSSVPHWQYEALPVFYKIWEVFRSVFRIC